MGTIYSNKTSKRVVLPLEKKPIMHGYTYTANFMSIIMPKARIGLSDSNISGLEWLIYGRIHKEYLIEGAGEGKDELVRKDDNSLEVNVGEERYIYLYNNVADHFICQFKLNAFKCLHRSSRGGLRIISDSGQMEIFCAFFWKNAVDIFIINNGSISKKKNRA